ncbi:Tigger transposable element-derived protein 6 [Araneus ventricosus]|uniref:Tigger transposable element-derived protein 6 n=1 Tax=Araneus ventricosus TaxID=182803 RepID=A0A4Y2APM8_ARAVE|nr:Tigger transposable element-derived protein 6 [Araneus ventricosus]
MGYVEFLGSNGWIEKFKRRHGITAKVISGESKDIDDNDSWITETLSKILRDYKSENIFNADEAALLFQCLPQKTLTFKKENCFGGKQSKAKLTVMLGLREKEEINDDVLTGDFLSLDSEAETPETLTELDILDSVKNKNNTAMNCDEGEDDEDGNDRDAEINKPSYDEMLKSFEAIRRGLQFGENTPEWFFGALQR